MNLAIVVLKYARSKKKRFSKVHTCFFCFVQRGYHVTIVIENCAQRKERMQKKPHQSSPGPARLKGLKEAGTVCLSKRHSFHHRATIIIRFSDKQIKKNYILL